MNEVVIESGKIQTYLQFVVYVILGAIFESSIIPVLHFQGFLRYVLAVTFQMVFVVAIWFLWKHRISVIRIVERATIFDSSKFSLTLKYIGSEVTLIGDISDLENVICETFTVGNGQATQVLIKIKGIGIVGLNTWGLSRAEHLCKAIGMSLSIIRTETQTKSLKDKDLARISELRNGNVSDESIKVLPGTPTGYRLFNPIIDAIGILIAGAFGVGLISLAWSVIPSVFHTKFSIKDSLSPFIMLFMGALSVFAAIWLAFYQQARWAQFDWLNRTITVTFGAPLTTSKIVTYAHSDITGISWGGQSISIELGSTRETSIEVASDVHWNSEITPENFANWMAAQYGFPLSQVKFEGGIGFNDASSSKEI
jgi:hypothetical protein